MARQPVKITDDSTRSVKVTDSPPSTGDFGLVVRLIAPVGTVAIGTTAMTVTNSTANPVPVQAVGTVSLSSASLAALETIDLGAATLAALETVTANPSPLPTVLASQVAVPVTQVPVPATNLAGRKSLSVKALAANGANAKVYIGLTGVTSTSGWELAAGESVDIDASTAVNLFAISSLGTLRVATVEVA